MNENRQTDLHYANTGFPYTATESFMDFFQVPVNYAHTGPLHDHDNSYWSMNMNAYKYGFSSGPESTSYYDHYEVNDNLPAVDVTRRAWEYPSVANQGLWQDDIDPDNMTYEELLDLGEAVGTESRGLSQELISMLPTSKCKFGSFFSRKKSGERCVICQMRYKRGEKQTKLPCKHVYHSQCITKWLGINKVCPVCNNEVFSEEWRH
ncbi:unnamed protein product [Linum tenue]|uniref:RING-type domain-containing protein n=1 Tax=Linum tenue TaxID=586396 RepID=A0AAV0J5Q6_9ROSI|nr:unnamed protein product [Linum tenue]